jgi:cytoskeletal protein RodZ
VHRAAIPSFIVVASLVLIIGGVTAYGYHHAKTLDSQDPKNETTTTTQTENTTSTSTSTIASTTTNTTTSNSTSTSTSTTITTTVQTITTMTSTTTTTTVTTTTSTSSRVTTSTNSGTPVIDYFFPVFESNSFLVFPNHSNNPINFIKHFLEPTRFII